MTRTPASASDRGGAWRHPGWRAVAACAVLAILATAALGGFREADLQALPLHAAGQTTDAGALAITPLRAWRTRTLPGRSADPASHDEYLVLRARIENRTRSGFSAASYVQSDIVWLPPGPAQETVPDTVLRGDDHSPYVAFPPRLATEVDLTWKVAPGTVVPARPTWGVYARRFVARTYLVRESAWIQDGPSAKLSLAVEDRRAQEAAP